jgi:sigma-B regulation protein RsbU (phosphoserine phosphatase)
VKWRALLPSVIGGVLFAWLLLILMAFRQPKIYDLRIFALATATGALFALAVRWAAGYSAKVTTTSRSIGCGCGYACAAFFFFCAVGGIAAMFTQTSFVVSSFTQLAVVLATFGGLGIFGGVMFARLRRAEGERQRAALEHQQLELARDLQQRLLPPPRFESERFRIVARNVPAAYVAGDFYDFVPIANDRMLIVIADVAGKGVAAGLIVATVKAMIPLLAANAESPDAILRALNARIAPQLSKREFVAMAVAIFDPGSGRLSIANAGVPDPILIRGETAEALVVEGPRYPVGVRASMDYRSLGVTMNRGDRVLFFTDGLAEASVEGEPLGYRRLSDTALQARGDVETLFMAVEAMTTGMHEDDWTGVSLERL